tara:strand:+ start:1395 stop:2825 length:1431 start_codon:yes stop_codon:yes gene_type:complete
VNISDRKSRILDSSNSFANDRLEWKKKSSYFHKEDKKYLSFIIPKKSNILEIGCGVGDLLASLEPSRGVGIDISESMIINAKKNFPKIEFLVGDAENHEFLNTIQGTFDYILLSDTIGYLDDCQSTLNLLHKFCNKKTRIVISYFSYSWQPVLKLLEILKLRMPQVELNFLPTNDIRNLLLLANFDVVKEEWKQLLPASLFGVGNILNKYFSALPVVRGLCLRNYIVGRSLKKAVHQYKSCSIIIPCRNERGNIENAVLRIPDFCEDLEIIFIEGHSEDGTYDEIKRIKSKYSQKNIKALKQDGYGKADAVYKAFDNSSGEVLIILDADLTVPPEQLGKFWDAINSGMGEYINGSRLVYPMEKDAMRFLNLMANQFFSIIFSWLLNQRYTDTLCGTKALSRSDYLRIKKNQSYFGNFDPFGDFDLIFGSSKLNLKMVEIPVKYKARIYGSTQIARFRHGFQLLRMVIYGYRKLKLL